MHDEVESNSPRNICSKHPQYLKYKSRATIIGWLGTFLSILVLLSSALLLRFGTESVHMQQNNVKDGENIYFENLRSAVLASSLAYVLSLINILVCSMLLIGITRDCAMLLFPWLLYHGLLFGIILFLAIYVIICQITMPLQCFILTALLGVLTIVIFIKIVSDVLNFYIILALRGSAAQPTSSGNI